MENNGKKLVGGNLSLNGKVYTIFGGVNQIGRNRDAIVNIKSLGVSQHHALFILVNNDTHYISDLKSSNGTFLNGEKLEPFHLYSLEDGSSIKFANLQGIYYKCELHDVDHQDIVATFSETQNLTQTFYGSNTQIMDNTFKQPQNPPPDKNYIPSQILAEVADRLEDSIVEIHESPTQVIITDDTEQNESENSSFLPKKPVNMNCDESTFDLHEAETQVIVTDEEEVNPISSEREEGRDIGEEIPSDIHEAETQVSHYSNEDTSVKSIMDLHEIEIDNEVEFSQGFGCANTPSLCNNDQVLRETSPIPSTSGMNNRIDLSLDDVIKPVGLSKNILNDSIDSSLSDNDTEMLKPLGKSSNLFTSQDSADENCDKNETDNKCETSDRESHTVTTNSEKSDRENDKFEENPSGTSDHESHTVTANSEKSDQENDRIADNPSDLDESQCQIMRPAKKSWNLFQSQDSDDSGEDSNDSVDFMTMQKIPSTQKLSISEEDSPGKQTNIQDVQSCELFEKSSNNTYFGDDTQTTDAETDIEENHPNSKEKIFKKGRKSGRKSENKAVPAICSDSDTDIENETTINKEADRNESVGLILEESTLDDNEKPENLNSLSVRQSVGRNDLNDSDFIPSTQDEQPKSASQNSKFENSENSFKLGLTQLMEEDNTSQTNREEEITTEKKESQTSQDSQKKFKFKKSVVGVTKSVDITLDLNEDIYGVQTQDLSEKIDNSADNVVENAEKMDKSIDDECFLKPTQEAPKKTKKKDESVSEDEIYILSTQKLDGTSVKSTPDDFYQQSTQKFVENEGNNSSLSDNLFYQLPTQEIPENQKTPEINKVDNKNLDDFDIFATQAMVVGESPTKCLESELENMFSTQRTVPADDYLDKIQDIVTEKGISDDKLPQEDKDLEAILCTQKMLDSPKTPKKQQAEEMHPEKSVESQLEVIFSSQTNNLPLDKFVRPQNPLLNILGADTQNTEEMLKEENNSIDKNEKEIEDPISTHEQKNNTLDNTETNNIEDSITSKTKQKNMVGLEQSFALLEAGSTKIRRSKRKKDCEEISVSCPKTRVSVVLASNDEEVKPSNNSRSSRKRQPPAALENYVTASKEPRRSKRRRFSETSNTSEEDEPDISSKSIKQKNKSEILSKIQEDDETTSPPKKTKTVTEKRISKIQKKGKVVERNESDEENKPCSLSIENIKNKVLSRIHNEDTDPPKRPETPNIKRSSRIQKKKEYDISDEENEPCSSNKTNMTNQVQVDEENDPPKRSETPSEKRSSRINKKKGQNKKHDDDENEPYSLSEENIKNKLLNKIQEDEDPNNRERPETPFKKRASRMTRKENEQHKQMSESDDLNVNKINNKTKTKGVVVSENEENGAIGNNINKSKDSDEMSADSGFDGSNKKKEKNKKEPISRSKGSKLNKNNDATAEIEVEEGNASHIKETLKKSKRNVGQTKETELVNSEVRNSTMNQSNEDFEKSSTNSRTSKRGCAIEVTTPSKVRKVSEVTPSLSKKLLHVQDTPNRSKRKLKPKVVFTMMENPQLESHIKQLGGSVVDSVDASTVLLTKFVKRSMKLLSAVGLSKPICSEDWVKQSRKENNFLDPWDFILVDKEAEKKWDFSLKTSLERSSQAKLFEGYTFQLLVTNALDVLKGAIESCGGKTVSRTPKESTNFVVVASADQKTKYKKILKQNLDIIVVEPEAIFDGVLRQEIRFERHMLK